MAPKRKRNIKSAAVSSKENKEVEEGSVETSVNIAPDEDPKAVAIDKSNTEININKNESSKPNGVAIQIPDGRPKSGRPWKIKQSTRTSMDKKKGVMYRFRKSYDTHKQEREKKLAMKILEREMKAEKQEKKDQEKARREEKERRRKENEFKTSSFQQINGEKLKKMSKKQLRNIAKTSMSKSGALELVPAYK